MKSVDENCLMMPVLYDDRERAILIAFEKEGAWLQVSQVKRHFVKSGDQICLPHMVFYRKSRLSRISGYHYGDEE